MRYWVEVAYKNNGVVWLYRYFYSFFPGCDFFNKIATFDGSSKKFKANDKQ